MYIVGEPSYRTSNWYLRILTPLKALSRKKRTVLREADGAQAVETDAGCAFVLGGSAHWITETVRALQMRGVHPIVLSELPDGTLTGRYSRVRTDYRRFVSRLAEGSEAATAFYGSNPASLSDRARTSAFLSCFPSGEVFENNGSLSHCFEEFYERHAASPFVRVICANDFAAVSLLWHLRACDALLPTITVHASGEILSFFPEIRAVRVNPASLASAAFAIVDCIRQNPDFIGMEITVEDTEDARGAHVLPLAAASVSPENPFWGDAEMQELMRIEHLLSECDETDRTILRLLRERRRDIGEEAYLSDNGVKYRIKKMKRICAVESKSEIPVLLEKYGIQI